MNKFAWHVTPTRNITSILKHGLLPNMPEEDSDMAISLFKTEEDAIRETSLWLNHKWGNTPLSILKIDIDNLKLTENFNYEWITTNLNPIEPYRIIEIRSFNPIENKRKVNLKM